MHMELSAIGTIFMQWLVSQTEPSKAYFLYSFYSSREFYFPSLLLILFSFVVGNHMLKCNQHYIKQHRSSTTAFYPATVHHTRGYDTNQGILMLHSVECVQSGNWPVVNQPNKQENIG